eukprot:m.127263 g.127263  ORF g.127263 m.127263 type:complete len:813 (-) comp11207_c0_seq1:13-2451(-)
MMSRGGMSDKRGSHGTNTTKGAGSRLMTGPRISRPIRRRIKHSVLAFVLGAGLVALFAPDLVEDSVSRVRKSDEPYQVRVDRSRRSLNGEAPAESNAFNPRAPHDVKKDTIPPPPPPPVVLRGWNDSTVAHKVVSLPLVLPKKYLDRPEFGNKEETYRHWGFDLHQSNNLPIDRVLPDYRSNGCKAIKYPDPADMPKVSVIIIHFNEPMSTLLRNIISVINNSPPTMLGEIVLVDDNSTIDEKTELQSHLDKIMAQTKPGLIKSFRRAEHTGIVGARIRGAQEATYDVLVFLDSHCETLPGWLEPLVARIHEDSRRVVVPNIRGFHLDSLKVYDNDPWPPSKGVMSWRVNFVPITADLETDLLDPAHPFESPVRNPVMPGGLFAIDRKWFWESGAYDPELLYYGAEHVEMSVRIWMCGGSMEAVPCSNVGHIYREFNRFDNAFDPLIKNVHIGKVLNRNDARVASVWMDEYKDIFTRMRLLQGIDLGPNLTQRVELRNNLHCKSFKWYVENVMGPGFYIPDLNPPISTIRQGSSCLIAGGKADDKVPAMSQCVEPSEISPHEMVASTGASAELWTFTNDGHMQSAFMRDAKEFMCLRTTSVEMTSCKTAVRWDFEPVSRGIRVRQRGTDKCLARRKTHGDPAAGTIVECSNATEQVWMWEKQPAPSKAGVLLGGGLQAPAETGENAPSGGMCLDNMQRTRGGVGYYGCHRGETQQWLLEDGTIKVNSGEDACLGAVPRLGQWHCMRDDPEQEWKRVDGTFRPVRDNSMCLTSGGKNQAPVLAKCAGTAEQNWEVRNHHLALDLGDKFPSRYN